LGKLLNVYGGELNNVIISPLILFDHRISGPAKILYSVAAALTNGRGVECRVLGRILGIGRTSLNNILRELKIRDLALVKNRPGQPSFVEIKQPHEVPGGVQKRTDSTTPVHYNNTLLLRNRGRILQSSLICTASSTGRKRTLPPVKGGEAYIAYWNAKQGVPRHLNPDTKTYQKCEKYFAELEGGTFITRRPRLQRYVKEEGLPLRYIGRQWPRPRVLEGLDRMAELFQGERTGAAVQSLSDLLYNPYHPAKLYSVFLLVSYDKRYERMRGGGKKALEDPSPKLTAAYGEVFNIDNKRARQALILNLGELKGFYKSLPPAVFGDGTWKPHIKYKCPDARVFCLHYLTYLKTIRWRFTPPVGVTNINSEVFLRYLERAWGPDTTASGKGLKYYLGRGKL
jgi:hypothetical protein